MSNTNVIVYGVKLCVNLVDTIIEKIQCILVRWSCFHLFPFLYEHHFSFSFL